MHDVAGRYIAGHGCACADKRIFPYSNSPDYGCAHPDECASAHVRRGFDCCVPVTEGSRSAVDKVSKHSGCSTDFNAVAHESTDNSLASHYDTVVNLRSVENAHPLADDSTFADVTGWAHLGTGVDPGADADDGVWPHSGSPPHMHAAGIVRRTLIVPNHG